MTPPPNPNPNPNSACLNHHRAAAEESADEFGTFSEDEALPARRTLDFRLAQCLLTLVHLARLGSDQRAPNYARLRTLLDWAMKVPKARQDFGVALREQGYVHSVIPWLTERMVRREVRCLPAAHIPLLTPSACVRRGWRRGSRARICSATSTTPAWARRQSGSA